MSEYTEETNVIEEIIELDPENDDLVTVFISDLQNCRERLEELHEEGIPSVIVAFEDHISAMGPPVLQLLVRREDIEDVAEIFKEIWEEVLDTEGVTTTTSDVIDFSQDTIVCPGCETEISEVTEEGECPECGLFLGFPDEDPLKEEEANS